MLHDLKDAAVNVTTIAVTAGIGLAFLGGIGLIVAREAYLDWRGKGRKLPRSGRRSSGPIACAARC